MPTKRELAWEMRRNLTPSEALLWDRVRNNRLMRLHFRRQHVVMGLIADFYCHAARLVVEVDGPVHQKLTENDEARDAILRSAGLKVLHVSNSDVEHDIEGVLRRVLSAAGVP